MDKTEEKEKTTIEKIKDVLDELRPFLYIEGGDVEFIHFDEDEGIVYVRMMGACAFCANIDTTLEEGLLEAIKEKVPEVKAVINSPL